MAEREDEDEVAEDGAPATFTPTRAMEIAVRGDKIRRKIAVLLRREEKHSGIVSKCREERKTLTTELIELFEEHASGQGRLEFPEDGDGRAKPAAAPADDGEQDRFEVVHEDRRLAAVRAAPGHWVALVDGATFGDGLRTAQEAREFLMAEVGIVREAWPAVEWRVSRSSDAAAVPAPTIAGWRATPEVVVRPEEPPSRPICRVWKSGDAFEATIAGAAVVGPFATKAKAQRAVVKALHHQFEGLEVPTLTWEAEVAGDAGPEVPADGLEVRYTAKVGRKTAEVRQSVLGKWTGRIGGTPFAIDLPLHDAQALCEQELTRTKPDAKVTWERTEGSR